MWNLILSDEQAMIVESARGYLSGELPIERLRPHGLRPDPLAVRREIAGLGWLGIGLTEAAGGSGLGAIGEALIQRECGRVLASPTILATTLATHLAEGTLAQELIAGERWAALGIGSGDEVLAFDRQDADLLLVLDGETVSLNEGTALHSPDTGLDDSVTLQRVRAGAPLLVGTAETALRAEVLLAAALCGIAEHACDLAVDYAKVRVQYGKAIGSFQAIKHRCADMGVRARLAWYQTALAALKLDAGEEDAALHCASAKLLAAEAAHENGRAGIQIHGGIGFQAECDAHWFVKRAHLYDQAGTPRGALARKVAALPAPL